MVLEVDFMCFSRADYIYLLIPELQVPEDTLFRGLYKTVQTVKQSHRGVAKVHQDTVREALTRAF